MATETAPRMALVTSWLNQYGGAERVLEVMHGMYPEAPVYTSIYGPEFMPQSYRSWDIRTSFMQHLPGIMKNYQTYFPLYRYAFEQFDLRQYDVVLSNTSAFAQGVLTKAETMHVCYCLTPTRFLWNYFDYVQREQIGMLGQLVLPFMLSGMRVWDRAAADRVDHFIAISRVVARRIAKFYRRPSVIIPPPVDASLYHPDPRGPENYFLIVSRLIPYKRIDLAVKAFNLLGLPLKIVGRGRDMEKLQAMAKSNITFEGYVPDNEVKNLYARCRAFIFPGEEDFGISPLEANAAGRPVIAYAGGGALDTVLEGETGMLFKNQTPQALAETVRRFIAAEDSFDPARIRRHAEQYDIQVFTQCLRDFIDRKYVEHLATLNKK